MKEALKDNDKLYINDFCIGIKTLYDNFLFYVVIKYRNFTPNNETE